MPPAPHPATTAATLNDGADTADATNTEPNSATTADEIRITIYCCSTSDREGSAMPDNASGGVLWPLSGRRIGASVYKS
ncbi:hypothetical protein GCM10023317_93810 [Actinopolymorpha pittospori]